MKNARGVLLSLDCAIGKIYVPRHNARMHKAFVLAALIALSLGLSACSKCDVYRYAAGPKVCAGS